MPADFVTGQFLAVPSRYTAFCNIVTITTIHYAYPRGMAGPS